MYYRLTYTSSPDKFKLGDSIYNGKKLLNIGQGNYCNIQLPESMVYEPQLYATILFKEDGGEWYVIRRTDCHDICVNGEIVNIAQILHNGDILSFSVDNIIIKLKFELFDDGEYDSNSESVYRKNNSKKFLFASFTTALLAIGIAVYALFIPKHKDIRHEDLTQYTQSVYHVTCDSVYLICESDTVEAIELNNATEGTAFLTTDSLNEPYFVTARHCVEPWINDEKWDSVSENSTILPEVRLAIIAETHNKLNEDNKYELHAHCIISKGFERYDYYSTDFFMNKSRDLVMRIGNADEVFYWRTIFPIAHRRNMELGDFAYVKAKNLPKDKKIDVKLAGWDDIINFAKSKNHDIAVVGYPLNDNDADEATVVYGNLMSFEFIDSIKEPIGCLQLSAPINPGNSGGPIIAKIDNNMKVIGIVSKADGRANQGMFWAVPVTEMTTMHQKGDKTEEYTETYRR